MRGEIHSMDPFPPAPAPVSQTQRQNEIKCEYKGNIRLTHGGLFKN